MTSLMTTDPHIAQLIKKEKTRQTNNIILIASENYPSKAVLEAQGSVLTNKYAEGYPGKRYYAGCENVDVVEQLAIDRSKALFKAEHVNVQPHSGAQANMAVYFALLKPGDTVLGMRLDQGGHLTHGSKVNFSGKLYNFVSYGVNKETELIDFEEIEQLAKLHKPKLIVAGATAYPRIIDFKRFREIADMVGATLMVDMAHISGLVAAGVHPSCIPHAQVVTTTTHKSLRGPRGAIILSQETLAKPIDKAVFPTMQGGPFMHIIAAKAVAFSEASTQEFIQYGKYIIENAKILADELQNGGLRIVSGGTDNHLMLVDLNPIGITGQEAEEALSRVNIIVNKNTIPYDPKPPRITSGLRLGTPALTSRGFGPAEMKLVATYIIRVLTNLENHKIEKETKEEVINLTSGFSVPGITN